MFLYKADDRKFALEVIEEDQIPSGSAHSFHLQNNLDGIRHSGNEVGGQDSIKAVVGKSQVGGVHFKELDVMNTQ